MKSRRFPATERRLSTYLFCESETAQETDIGGSNEHGNKKRYKAKYHYPQNIMIHKLLRMIVDKISPMKSFILLEHCSSYL